MMLFFLLAGITMTREMLQKKCKVPLELAEKVIKILHEITGNKVNFMGENGIITASAQPERIGTVHEGGKIIMSGKQDEISITGEMAEKMKGALPGYNGVVKYHGERIGCIGIGGEPEKVKPLQKLAEVIIIEELERKNDQNERQKMLHEIVENITDISDRIGVVALNGSIQSSHLGHEGNSFKVVANEMKKLSDEIAKLINQIEERAFSKDIKKQYKYMH